MLTRRPLALLSLLLLFLLTCVPGARAQIPATPANFAATPQNAAVVLTWSASAGASFNYAFSLPNGNYVVALYFAEIQATAVGQRVFTVKSGTQTLPSGFDVFATAGGANKAIVQTFAVPATAGKLALAFTGTTGSAACAAIVIAPLPTGGGIISGIPVNAALDVPPPGWAQGAVPTDEGSDADGEGPSMGQGVSLPSGSSENSPGPDLWAYNPLGPAAAYGRLYRSRRADTGYAAPGLSPGWTDNYDSSVTFNSVSSTYTLTSPNGAQETWAGATGALTPPAGSPYLVTQTPLSGPTPAFITVTSKDRTKATFTQFATAAGGYPANAYLLTGLTNLVGRSVTLVRDAGGSLGHRIGVLRNDAATPQALLTFAYDVGTGRLTTVTDTASNSRQVAYAFASGSLASVSQIVPVGTAGPPLRWQYGYVPLPGSGQPYLTSVTAPDPATPGGVVSAYVDYFDTGSVAIQQDADGSVRSYSYGSPVTVQISKGGLTEFYQQKYSPATNTGTGFRDGAGKSTSVSYAGTPSPYLPSAFTSRIPNQTTSLTYDAVSGVHGNVFTTLDPRGDQTTLTYDYTNFPLGQVQTVQESHLNAGMVVDAQKQATTLSYYAPSDGAAFGPINGLVKTVVSPAPDSTFAVPATVTSSYTYTLPVFSASVPAAGGQAATVTEPGSAAFPAITTAYNYTTDGTTFIQNEQSGEPITATDNLGEVTHFRYDTRGNLTSVMDAVGNVTQFTYNLADQQTGVLSPATNTQGPGNAQTVTAYQYVGGPAQSASVFDEAGTKVREVDTTYTHEGSTASVTGSTQPSFYTYDERARMLTLKDGNNNVTNYDYDVVGNLSHVYYPGYVSGSFDKTTYGYDADQNLTSEIDGRGVTKTYTRTVDPESQVTQVAYTTLPAGVTAIQPVNYSYDVFGRRAAMNDGNGSTTGVYSYAYGYDDLDELLSQTVSFAGGPQSQPLTYTHNPDGTRLSLALPVAVSNPLTINGGKFTYAYDGVRRLGQITLPHIGTSLQHTWNANGWLYKTYGPLMPGATRQATRTFYTYNARGFLTSLNNYQYDPISGFTVNASFYSAMTYDALGNRLTETATIPPIVSGAASAPDASHQVTYTYDTGHSPASLNRDVLTEEKSVLIASGSSVYNDVYDNLFGYDAAYNPTAFGLDGVALLFPVNLDNQFSGSGFAWDGGGDPTTYQGAAFGFDPEDRLTSISSPAFAAQYDGDGLRVTRTEGGTKTYFLDDGGSPVAEETFGGGAATLAAVNTVGADGARVRYYPTLGGQYYAFDFDPQGSTVGKQYSGNTSGAGFSTSFYEGYGKRGAEYTSGGSSLGLHDPWGFGGQYGYYTDASGLSCLTHRYYDAGAGKFLSRDPLGYGGGVNLYGFCDDNPVNESDPSGYRPLNAKDNARFAKLLSAATGGNRNLSTRNVPPLIGGAIASLKQQIGAVSGSPDPVGLRVLWYAIDHLGDTSYGIGNSLGKGSSFSSLGLKGGKQVQCICC